MGQANAVGPTSIEGCSVSGVTVAVNVALMRTAIQSSTHTFQSASLSVDGTGRPSCTAAETSPWWSVDLGTLMDVGRVCVTNHADSRLGRFRIHADNNAVAILQPSRLVIHVF